MADPATANMFLDVNNLTSLEFRKWKSTMYSLALTNGRLYYKLRSVLLQELSGNISKLLYKTVYNILSEGQNADGTPIQVPAEGTDPAIRLGKPKFPFPKINSIGMEMVNEMLSSLEQIVEILMPEQFEKIASSKMVLAGKGASVSL